MEGGAQGVDKCNVIAAAETWHLGWQGYVSARRHSDGPIFNPNRYLRRFSMKRVTKWVGTGLAGLVGLVVIAMAIVYGVTSRRLSKVYNVTDSPLTIPSDSVSIVKGYHIVQAIGKCAACHGDDLAGKVVFDNPVMGRLYSANLTRGRGGIGGSYKDADYVRIIRHGVARDGHPLQFMPPTLFTTSTTRISPIRLRISKRYLRSMQRYLPRESVHSPAYCISQPTFHSFRRRPSP
jgi:hypothetical protein